MERHQEAVRRADQAIEQARVEAGKDDWRLRFHVTPPAGWMNDPNGFCYFRGEYHLFYQHHPYSPYWNDMHWGHAKSADLAHWVDLPIALAPSEPYDRDGCFSGSAIEKDGRLYLMYTGHSWTGPDRDVDLLQVQCLAASEDGVRFEKLPGNPAIAKVPEGDVHPNHFRDPKVWQEGEWYYCVLGSKTKENIGQMLLYRSKELTAWEFVGVSATDDKDGAFMWECPDLFRLGDRDVLVVSPQGMKPEGDRFHNLHQSGYMLGRLDRETGVFEHEPFEMLDYGFDFYAPQTTTDANGRRVLIAWMAMWESEMPEQGKGWAGAMTLPRELRLEDGRIVSRPVPELAALRGTETAYEGVAFERELTLSGVEGDGYELELELDVSRSDAAGIKLRASAAGDEETVLSWDRAEGKITLDRSRSGQGPGGVRKAPVALEDGRLRLRLFVDRSSVEAFVGAGEKVMTARIYPDPRSTGVKLFSDGPATVVRLRHWSLKGMKE